MYKLKNIRRKLERVHRTISMCRYRLLLVIVGLIVLQSLSEGTVVKLLNGAITTTKSLLKMIGKENKIEISELATNLNQLRDEMKYIEDVVMNTDKMMHRAVNTYSRNSRLESKLNELGELVSNINSARNHMDRLVNSSDHAENFTIENFAKQCVFGNDNTISNILEKINEFSVPSFEPGLINPSVHHLLLITMKESNSYMCDMQQSSHQLLSNMYNKILLAEIKGYTMIQFSWMFLTTIQNGNFTAEIKEAQLRFEQRINMTINACQMLLKEADRFIRRCEPDEHIEGETYVAITQFLQGYIENEVNMNVDRSCRHNCAYYQLTKYQTCFEGQFCEKQKQCRGKIIGCKFVESDMTICQSAKNSTRRYDWIKFKTGKTYGKNKQCSGSSSKVDSWWRWLFWHCSYCMCICEQSGPESDRYFSLKEASSNIEMNMVITGIRFTKVNRVIYLQISEGTLLPGGKIDSKSITWKKIEPMDMKYAYRDVDYHELTNEKRAIDLDDLEGPKGHAMTGLQFQILEGHLHLQIRTTMFDFNNGTLLIDKHSWISNNSTKKSKFEPRQELKLENLDIPVATKMVSQLKSTKNQYLEFTHSNFEKDAAQTTVPYLDAQPVINGIPGPLSGAGIFYKGSPGYGGFIALNINTYDFSYHINDSL